MRGATMGIADNIRILREEHGMTQADLGAIAGVSDKAVSTWENGTAYPRIGTVERMASYFHIPKSQITGDEEERRNARLLAYYEEFKNLISLASRLDEIDRARLEERAQMMLESDKYKKNDF